jgi:hypothetical protein
VKSILSALLIALMCGCTYSWQSKEQTTPVTYEAARVRSSTSLGNLRRLAVMPLEIKNYDRTKDNPDDSQRTVERKYEEACAEYLIDKKGYEIVLIGDAAGKWPKDLSANAGPEIEDLEQRWRQLDAPEENPSMIQDVGHVFNVDGVLLLRVKDRKAWNALDGILNIALLNIPLFYNISSPNIGAWIYETASGQLVWRKEYSDFNDYFGDYNKSGYRYVPNTITTLFQDLENAVPYHMIK